ncbi:MAG: hypothetical protein H6626_10615 [Pseudobdellovibrionaceae bacterium]|nr:hypothetical protein [Bdellovibrionales bacterium]USN46659.1 MAG: hypothetical protein H6626_10615 [Pseudobdellovibrionaceae bacterium]
MAKDKGQVHSYNRNSEPSDAEGDTSKLVILAILFVFVVGVHLTLSKKSGETDASSLASTDAANEFVSGQDFTPDLVRALNRRMRLTNTTADLQKAHVMVQNEKLAPRVNDATISALDKSSPKFAHEYGLQLEPEDHAKKVYQDMEALRQRQIGDDGFVGADTEISLRLGKDEWSDQYDETYKQEFVNAFLENAKKDGWSVQLNKNLDVVGLTRVPTNNPIRLPQSTKSTTGGQK